MVKVSVCLCVRVPMCERVKMCVCCMCDSEKSICDCERKVKIQKNDRLYETSNSNECSRQSSSRTGKGCIATAVRKKVESSTLSAGFGRDGRRGILSVLVLQSILMRG